MRIAVISDIHGNLSALRAVLADIARQGADLTVNLGDILSGPLQAAGTADLLMGKGFPTIRGNHERQLLALLEAGGAPLDPSTSDGFAAAQLDAAPVAWLRGLPVSLMPEAEVRLCHGTPDSDLQYWLETVVPGFDGQGHSGVRPASPAEVQDRLGPAQPALVLCGHTHVPRIVQCGGTLIVNPGSVGLQAYSDAHPWPHVIENGAPHARYALVERRPAGWQAELRAVPYDHLAQAAVALRNGRPDWAHALATGRMPPS